MDFKENLKVLKGDFSCSVNSSKIYKALSQTENMCFEWASIV